MTEPIRILYVDDNRHDRELVRDALEHADVAFEVVEASSRASFEAQIDRGIDFDLVLSDFNILGFTGLQVLDAVHQRWPRLPVVIVTGTGSEEVGVEAMKRGAADYVIKTTRHIQRLPQTILAALEQRRLHDEREAMHLQLQMQARIIDQIHDAVAEVDMEGIVRRWNMGSERLYGYRAEEMIGQTVERLYPPEVQGTRRARIIEPVLRLGQHELEVEQVRKDGERVWVHLSLSLLRDAAGRPVSTLAYAIDVTERRRAEHDLRLRQRALDASNNGVVICDANQPALPAIYVNPAFQAITGYAPDEVIGRSCAFLHRGDSQQPGLAELRQALAAQSDCRVLLRNYRKDGSLFWNELHIAPVRDPQGGVSHYVGIQNDVSERMAQQEMLVHRATHDELTGLPNRAFHRDTLDHALSGANGRRVGVVVVNLDRLHHVNDTLGYSCGDRVLEQAARRLQELALAHGAALGRIGGDEFMLFFATDAGPEAFETLALRATQALARPYPVGEQTVFLTASAGVSWFPDAGGTAAQLLGEADLALNLAKQQGRNQVVPYSAERSAELAQRIAIGAELRQALQRDEICLHYQPLVLAGTGEIVGAEALMRWDSGKLGSVAPSRFIAVAEDTGMIVRLGHWALRAALGQVHSLRAAGIRAVPVSVNVSAVQFQDPDFLGAVEEALRHADVEPAMLKLEITESLVLEDSSTVLRLLARLRAIGVRISLDDFGTGYSSLGQLRKLPIDEIKIDQSFVRDVVVDSYAGTLCRAIIAMSQDLHFTVVAEGVETAAQAEFLRSAGCRVLQGYLFGRPVPPLDFSQRLAAEARAVG